MQKNENPIILSTVLLVISVIVALLLSFTNSITKDKIAKNTQIEQNAAKKEVLPQAKEFEDLNYSDGLVQGIDKATDGDNFIGWCVNVVPYGYGGEIDIMVGILPDYTISDIKVVSNTETAGLGNKCKDPAFSGQFAGKKMPLSVIKKGDATDTEISAITGATVTSKAVTSGVNAAFDAVKKIGGGQGE